MQFRKLILPILAGILLVNAPAAEEYALPANERALWEYASELFYLTRRLGIIEEKTEEEVLEILPEILDLLERFNGDLCFWITDLTERGILDRTGPTYETLDHLLHWVLEKVSTAIAFFLDGQYGKGAGFIVSLRLNCESLTEYFHRLNY